MKPTRSAFTPMRAKLDPRAVAGKLPAGSELSEPTVKETAPVLHQVRSDNHPAPAGRSRDADRSDDRKHDDDRSPDHADRVELDPSDLVTIEIQIAVTLELANKPEKINCAWAFIERKNPPGTQRIGIVLNTAHWPTDGALARGDKRAARWLASLALLDRLNAEFKNPVLRGVRDYLVRSVLGDEARLWQAGLWAAYPLKDSPILARVDALPIFGTNPERGPHLVITFPLKVALPAGRSPEVRTYTRGKGDTAAPRSNAVLDRSGAPETAKEGQRQ